MRPWEDWPFEIGQRQLGDPAAAALSYRAYLRESPNSPNRIEVQKLINDMDRAAAEQHAQPLEAKQPAAETPPEAHVAPPPSKPVEAAPAPQVDPGLARRNRTLRLAGIGSAAGGVALLVLGGVFTAEAKSANEQISKPGVFNPANEDRRNTFQTLDVVFFVTGGVALAAGATLYLLGRRAPAAHAARGTTWVQR
jgi:hypothetical protein